MSGLSTGFIGAANAVKASPATSINNALNRNKQVAEELSQLLQLVQGLREPGEKDVPGIEPAPSLSDILANTDTRLDNQTDICLSHIRELRSILIG